MTYSSAYGPRGAVGQKRIAACMTDETGRFSFKVPSGDYELRFSKSPEWDVTSYCIKVRKWPFTSRRRLVVYLQIGT